MSSLDFDATIISEDMVRGISESLVQDVKKSTIELLAVRAFTVSELRKKLCGNNYSIDTVDSVIADFKSRGLLNDGYYAESFSRSRWQSSTWGPRRIKQREDLRNENTNHGSPAIRVHAMPDPLSSW